MEYIIKRFQGGVLIYTEDKLDQIKESLVKFQEKNDNKATTGLSLAYTLGQVWSIVAGSALV